MNLGGCQGKGPLGVDSMGRKVLTLRLAGYSAAATSGLLHLGALFYITINGDKERLAIGYRP